MQPRKRLLLDRLMAIRALVGDDFVYGDRESWKPMDDNTRLMLVKAAVSKLKKQHNHSDSEEYSDVESDEFDSESDTL